MLNADKENVGYKMEKNLARTSKLRPALRSSNIPTSLNHEDPKVSKHIRFNLSRDDQIGKNNSAISENMTPTPPPKEFKRNSQRKTLRNVRCMSTIVTEKEKSLLESAISSGHMDSPRAPQGFVKSMCKFYADNFSPSRLGSKLNRSNSFTSGQDSSSATSNSSASSSSNDQSPQSVSETSKSSETTRGSFRLFRSNSWSSRRKKTSEFSEIPVETTQIQNSSKNSSKNSSNDDDIDNSNRQRSSPSYSTKSQDSGCFSENGINGHGLTSTTNSTAHLIHNQRLQFLRSNMELREDDQDPNLTQANSANNSADFPPKKPNVNTADSSSKTKLTESLGNIASLQTGLNIKRQMAEGDLTEPLPAPPTGTLANLLRPQRPQHDKIRPKSFQDSVNDLSQLSQDFLVGNGNGDTPVFSTPVRASFRGAKLRPRPHTVIHLEDARTPSKREAKTRLRELKTKASRHFSGDIIADPDQDVPNGIGHGIEPSLVAVWSQFVNYEPSIPALSSVVTPSINNSCYPGYKPGSAAVPASAGQLAAQARAQARATSNSSCISAVNGARAGQLTSDVVCVDDHLSLDQLSATQCTFEQGLLETTRLSQLPSLRADDTETQLLAESFNNKSLLLNCPSQTNSLGGNEEALIEMVEMKIPKTSPDRSGSRNSSRSNATTNSNTKINTSPVCEWWKDLHAWCEPECMTYLQSKPILTSMGIGMASPMSMSPSSSCASEETCSTEDYFNKDIHQGIVNTMKQLQRGAKSISVTFSTIDKHLSSKKNLGHLGKTVQALLNQVQKYVYDYNMGRMGQGNSNSSQTGSDFLSDSFKNHEWNFPGLRKNVAASPSEQQNSIEQEIKSADQDGIKEIVLLQQRTVLQAVDRLKLCAHRSQYSSSQPLTEMTKILSQLRKTFEGMVDKMFTKELRPLVREIDHPTSSVGVRSALHSVIALGNEAGMGNSSQLGNATCNLLAKEGCVAALIKQCNAVQQKCQDVRVLALRGLSSICCVAECIREFEKAEGLRIIEQLLCSRGSLIEDRIEAAGVLAQITSPWISDNHKINHLDNFVYNMVNALTGLSRMNGGEETFLLVTAALANLTFMSPLSSAAMKRCGTPEALIKAVHRSPFTTLFAKDQVVTVLANMAANANCRYEIEAINGVGFLISMLETKNKSLKTQAEISAAERVQKKSAIALSRLCNSTKVCRDLIRLNGVDRLVELCQNPSERNYSDAVLVSCLAVLRRLNANLESEQNAELKTILKQLKADDLVKPNLVDSFVEYSAKQESYV